MRLKSLRTPSHCVLAFVFLLFIQTPYLLARTLPVQKRAMPKEMSTSVIIPCDVLHLPCIFPLLENFKNQTILPNEIVISLSNIGNLHKEEIYNLENHSWPFSVKIISHTDKKSAGANRNVAANHASGDILICQDADDLPHPQRVEIVKYMFQTYDIDHLFHAFISYHKSFIPYEVEQIHISRFRSLDEMSDYCNKNHHHITNGNVSFTQEVIKNIRYLDSNSGEDAQFNKRVHASYKSATIFAKLLMYRAYLSANNPNFSWPSDIDF